MAELGGAAFGDADVVASYRHRPPYPAALHARLVELAAGRSRLLDLGCGPGKLAHALAGAFDHVDAVDPSSAMLEAARGQGEATNIRWVCAGAEDAPLAGPYDLAVAGAAIHWMDHARVMPRLAAALAPGAPLALVEGDGPTAADWREAFQAVIVRWVEKGGRAWQDRTHTDLVTAHLPWIDVDGEEVFAHVVRQPVEDLIEAQHSRATWARTAMGVEAAAAFDADLRAVLAPAAIDGELSFTVETRLTWGRPRRSPRPDRREAEGFAIQAARSPEDLQAVAALFTAYAGALPVDLGYQDFAAELAGLPAKYAPPDGELLLARAADGEPVGCVALRPLAEPGVCEMKRLFLRAEARGAGLGRALAEAVVGEARRRGYRELRLDTLPGMAAALALYADMGFVPIAPYYGPTPEGTVFLGLTL